MEFRFLRELYPRSVLLKSAYQFTDRAYIHLDADESHYIVSIEFKDGPCFDYKEFKNEMLIQSVRHDVFCQTKELRTLTVARALSSTLLDNSTAIEITDESVEEAIDDSFLNSWFDGNADYD